MISCWMCMEFLVKERKMIRVLITGCSMHSYDLIQALRENSDCEEIYVVGINCEDTVLSRKGVDAWYVVPRITSPYYVPELMEICKKEKVDIILPFITAELPIACGYKPAMEGIGVRVSVSSRESLEKTMDKTKLMEMYPLLMPRQVVLKKTGMAYGHAQKMEDLHDFAKMVQYPEHRICCKLPDRCGGLGFCIVDEEKGRDLTLYNKFGANRYVTIGMLEELLMCCHEDVILQEYVEGTDYSMCVLADHGKVLYGLGFEAGLMAFGSAMYAEIKQDEYALAVASRITEETGLDGNACFDFIRKPDGSMKLLEVNPRVSATLPFVAKAGLNLPYLRCRQLLGYDISGYVPEIRYGLEMRKSYVSNYS